MNKLELVKGEEVVFCPVEGPTQYHTNRGADGVIHHRQTTKSKGRTRVKSILVKWRRWRGGISCFRLKGRRRPKSDWHTALFDNRRGAIKTRESILKMGEMPVTRFEEDIKDLHPLSYCHDCPLRLRRMLVPCNMSKKEAIEKHGKVE